MKLKNLIFTCSIALLASCGPSGQQQTETETATDSLRIVSINGTVSEILASLGMVDQIVGTDVTSTYPESLQSKPKVGHNRKLAIEGILSLDPDVVIGTEADMSEENKTQLTQTGIKVQLFQQDFSTQGTKTLIRQLADSLGKSSAADSVLQILNQQLDSAAQLAAVTPKPRVLFIYARGAGTMMVGGQGTQIDEMIRLADGENVARDISDYKPLTPEALVKYNPDVILLFDSGLSSLGGADGLLAVKGVAQTNAGKNKKIVEMDGQLLSGFGPRVALAIDELYHKIH